MLTGIRRVVRRRSVTRRPWKLRTRLALALLIVVGPIAALLLLSHIEGLQDQRRSQVESFETIGDTLRANVDSFARDLESLSFAASVSLSSNQMPTQASVGPYLANLNNTYGNLRAIFVTNTNGTVIASDSGALNGEQLGDRDYVHTLEGGTDSVWSSGTIAAEEGHVTVVHGRVIRTPQGKPLAFLFVAMYPTQLTNRLPEDLPSDANVSLIDQHGEVLFSTNPGKEPVADIGGSSVFNEVQQEGSVLIEGESSPVDSGPRYGAYLRVPRTGWTIGFTRPAEVIDGPFQSRLRRDLVVMSMLVLAGVAFMLLVASKLSRPLSSLANTADAIARGEQPAVPIDAADADVQKLERAMLQMSQAINKREENLISQTRVGETLELFVETLSNELDLVDAFIYFSVAALQLTQAKAVGIYYFEHEDAPELELLGVAGSKTFPMEPEDPLIQRTMRGEVLDITEVGVFPGALAAPQLETGAAVHSFLGIPIRSRFGDVHGGLFLVHDKQGAFTERHRLLATGLARRASIVVENARLYSQARAQQEELRQASMQKSEFIGMMSHELRTPITTIFGGARLLNSKRTSLDQQSFDDMLLSIEQEAERLYRLVENLLTLAKTELYEEIEMDVMSLGPVVDRAVKQFSDRHPGRPIRINVAKDVQFVMGEPVYLHQVLNNLITNADKYSEPGKPLDLSVSSRNDMVTVKVMDRGPGVKPDELEMIFESFYRSKSTSRKAGGKGLGLTVCKRLIEAMGGTIWVRNRRGGGLEACFSLPAAIIEGLEEESPEPLTAAATE
jgi:signal transduction histidine kinase/HAMP domain-containing protein